MTVFCTESYENTNNVLKQEKKKWIERIVTIFEKSKKFYHIPVLQG